MFLGDIFDEYIHLQ